MADYFTEYPTFAKGLPSPADTPYETPADFIRSKRSSRTAATSRDHSVSPPLPPDTSEYHDKSRDGRYPGVDPRRFTPTLHASLVSEILNLRRELDSKNNLVENLETTLSSSKAENDNLAGQLSESAKDIRKAKQQVQQMEKGVYDAVEDLVKERDAAQTALDDLRNKLDTAQRRTRKQDEDALRTQNIWEDEKEAWDNERRQLERRVHVTETRLRAVVDEMTAQQNHASQQDDHSDETNFKDSGLGEGSDTTSIRSASPTKHKRNMSNSSFRARTVRGSVQSRTSATPDLYARPGHSLADELGIDEEDEYDGDDFEPTDDNFGSPEGTKRQVESRQNSLTGEWDARAKRIIDLARRSLDSPMIKGIPATLPAKPSCQDRATTPPPRTASPEPVAPCVIYVDTGYQPSPPASPPSIRVFHDTAAVEDTLPEEKSRPTDIDTAATREQSALELRSQLGGSPISPPQTPVIDGISWTGERASSAVAPVYSTASTQTEFVEPEVRKGHTAKRDSLSPPMFVPSIAIHPPSSRPSSPRPHVLPPGTRNASSQANLGWPGKDACVQTEEIRVDRRPVKLPAHLLPSNLLPSPTFQEPIRQKRGISGGNTKVLLQHPSIPTTSVTVSPPLQSPTDESPEMSRNNSAKDLRSHPLKAIPLPRPVLSPPGSSGETFQSNGPLNRSSQYGVSQPKMEAQLLNDDQYSETSEHDELDSYFDFGDLTGSMPALSRPPPGRFGLSEPPKAVPEDKEISPERRPATADSWVAAPAPSVSSSRATSQQRHARPSGKLPHPENRKDFRSRSPSFGSHASSSRSVQSSMPLPPYPIPLRSSSRISRKSHSEGSQSPTQRDTFGTRNSRSGRSQLDRQISLRKVQSAAVIRNRSGRGSPNKHRRRRRSPNLTPVQSMLFESPTPTKFPIPELPTPLQDNMNFDYVKGSVDLTGPPSGPSSQPRVSEETNLVDAIAATMVGEWMWKYIRKRKSFGIGEDSSEFPVADQNGIVNNVTAHGTRHKRWVWLSPYERTIMWDNKQPTSGPALLGKKGRKLAIQSVLDVQDLTVLPKSPELKSVWKRSILILTPERALKFTAINEERHLLWMTALHFLARSGQLPSQIPQKISKPMVPPVPPVPNTSIDGVPIKRQRSPSFGRSRVRDSIRLAHGKRPDHLNRGQAHTDRPYATDMNAEYRERNDSADFPAVPRLYISTTRHQRKRSNTSPRLPPTFSNLRSFSSGAATSTSSAHQYNISTNASSFRPSASSKSGSQRDSIASPERANFFEAVGTVRMEAFVDPNVRDGVLYVPAPPPVIGGTSRRPRRGSNLSQSTVDKRRAGYVFDEDGMDPFKGF